MPRPLTAALAPIRHEAVVDILGGVWIASLLLGLMHLPALVS